MIFAYITLLTALAISGVAAYYSIIGLVAIFSASVIPIAVMGVVLETGKLVSAAWLYHYWRKVNVLLKTYLISAVLVLMFIWLAAKSRVEKLAPKLEKNLKFLKNVFFVCLSSFLWVSAPGTMTRLWEIVNACACPADPNPIVNICEWIFGLAVFASSGNMFFI